EVPRAHAGRCRQLRQARWGLGALDPPARLGHQRRVVGVAVGAGAGVGGAGWHRFRTRCCDAAIVQPPGSAGTPLLAGLVKTVIRSLHMILWSVASSRACWAASRSAT